MTSIRSVTKWDEPITPDYLSQEESVLLISMIRDYWRRKGFENVRLWTEPANTNHNCMTWAVRSNMKNGMPQKTKLN